jgi:hypothetical protein
VIERWIIAVLQITIFFDRDAKAKLDRAHELGTVIRIFALEPRELDKFPEARSGELVLITANFIFLFLRKRCTQLSSNTPIPGFRE